MTSLGLHFETKDILLIGASLVLLVPFILWWVLGLKRFFPLAVIQIFAGVMLGPTLLGALAPDLFKFLFTDQPALKLYPATSINAIAIVAVSLFAFNAGTEADVDKIKASGPSVLAIGLGGFLFTWMFGGLVGMGLAEAVPGLSKDSSNFQYAIVFGLCNAVPALPILAVMLGELKLSSLRIGHVTLAAAGIGDALLWASIAIILPFAPTQSGTAANWMIAAVVALTGFVASFLFCTKLMSPLLRRLKASQAPERVTMILVGFTIFGSASITAIAGLHAVMGAFIAGVFLPHDVREEAAQRLDMPTALLLLPFFFLATGLKADFNLANSTIWVVFAAGIITCYFGKLIGTALFAKLSGETLSFGAAAGMLLQTKGLMELVVVTIFSQKGFVGPETFSALVAVALTSTALTMPSVSMLLARSRKAIMSVSIA